MSLQNSAIAGNAARNEKWRAVIDYKKQLADASTTSAAASASQARAAHRQVSVNAQDNQAQQGITSQNNLANQGISRTKNTNDYSIQKKTLEQDAPLRTAQAAEATAAANKHDVEASNTKSIQGLRETATNPYVVAPQIEAIERGMNAISGTQAKAPPLHVVPQSNKEGFNKQTNQWESIPQNPLIVDPSTGEARQAITPSASAAPSQGGPITPEQKAQIQARVDSTQDPIEKLKLQAEADELYKRK